MKTGYELLARAKVSAAGQISPQEQVRIDLKRKFGKSLPYQRSDCFYGGRSQEPWQWQRD